MSISSMRAPLPSISGPSLGLSHEAPPPTPTPHGRSLPAGRRLARRIVCPRYIPWLPCHRKRLPELSRRRISAALLRGAVTPRSTYPRLDCSFTLQHTNVG